ncbi:MAG: glycine cleavage system protein GcvH [Clostridia bacterium]|nr:glycine cleavage system protein GcvH [Clostridia bacterium]
MNNPQNLKYTQEHEWIKVDGNKAVIGITDLAQSLLGDVVFVELPQVGVEFAAHDTMGIIESVKAVSDIYAPVSGKVLEVNTALEDSPEIVNQDAFGKGWLVVLEIKDADELGGLLSAEDYEKLFAEEG